MYEEIYDLKQQGFSEREVVNLLKTKQGSPSIPTIRKYFREEVINDNLHEKLEKPKAFDVDPYKGIIISILKGNPRVYISSIYDVLTEKFVEEGITDKLPGNAQTLRNYVKHLFEKGLVEIDKAVRIYDYTDDPPPGEQMQLDFGEVRIAPDFKVHFVAILLRYSRLMCIYAQDHKFNATETCQALYRAFVKIGGRVKILVIDQDSVMVKDEVFGEIFKTRIFEDFCQEQDIKLFVCNKSDPETKGPIENTVGFVKKNFFSARKESFDDMASVTRSLAMWVERHNLRIHQRTYMVPLEVFEDTEKDTLCPLLPSVYDKSMTSFMQRTVGNPPYITYNTCKYSVPPEYIGQLVYYKTIAGDLYIVDNFGTLIAKHVISSIKGSTVKDPAHKKESKETDTEIIERLRERWNCEDFQHFVNGFNKEAKENGGGRVFKKQLSAVETFLNKENPKRAMVAQVMKECCKNFDYKYSQFILTYERIKVSHNSFGSNNYPVVNNVNLDIYDDTFAERSIL